MSVPIVAILNPLTDSGLTITARIYSGSTLADSVALTESPASSARYVGAFDAEASTRYDVNVVDGDGWQKGTGDFATDANGDEIKLHAPADVVSALNADTTEGGLKELAVNVLEAVQALPSTGVGPHSVSVAVENAAGDPVGGASVSVVSGGVRRSGTTGSSGILSFSLTDSTYTLSITAEGYTYSPTEHPVSAAATITATLTSVSAASPSDPSLSVGTLITYTGRGTPETGVAVTFKLVAGPGDDGAAFDGESFTITSTTLGVVTAEFVRGAKYDGWRGDPQQRTRFTVPDEDTFHIPEIVGRAM